MSIKKSAAKLGLANVLSIGLNFFSGVILTRILGEEGRGVLAKIEAGIGLLAQITTLKSHVGIIYFTANEKIAQRKLITIGISVIFTSLILSGSIIYILKLLGYSQLILPAGYTSNFFVLYALLLFLTTQGQILLSAFLRGIKNFQEVYVNQIFVSSSKLIIYVSIFCLALYFGRNISLSEGLIMHLGITLLALGSTIFFFLKNFKVKLDFNLPWKSVLAPFFGYVSISALSLIVNFLNLKLDIWLVEHYQGTSQLGFYAVAVNLCALISVLPNTFREVLLPYISDGARDDNVKNLIFFSRFTFTAVSLVALTLFLTSKFLIPFLYGSQFLNSVAPFNILLIGMIFNAVGVVFSAYNYGVGKPKLNLYANLVGLSLTIILGFVLIPRFGINGAAFSSAVAYFSSASLIIYSVLKSNQLPFRNYFLLTQKDLQPILTRILSARGKNKS